MTKSTNVYRTVVKHLTYQLKQETSYRAVVKNLHLSTPNRMIREGIEKEGHIVRNIVNTKIRLTKEPMSLLFVDSEQQL